MMRNTLIVLSSLLIIGCGGSEDSGTVTEADAADETSTTADTGSSTTDDTGSSTTDDTGSSTTDDTGSSTGDTGGSETAADTGTPPADTGGDAGAAATFTNIYNTILSAKCGPCHTSGVGAGNLDMKNKANAYADLVGKKAEGTACMAGGKTRVVAGNAAMSLLVDKVENATPSCGSRMPRMAAALSAGEIGRIKSWINAGALNN